MFLLKQNTTLCLTDKNYITYKTQYNYVTINNTLATIHKYYKILKVMYLNNKCNG